MPHELIKALMDLTSMPFLDCRMALEACSWDLDKAVRLLWTKFGGIMDG